MAFRIIYLYIFSPSAILTIWKVGKDGVEAGTSFVPVSIIDMGFLLLLPEFIRTPFQLLIYCFPSFSQGCCSKTISKNFCNCYCSRAGTFCTEVVHLYSCFRPGTFSPLFSYLEMLKPHSEIAPKLFSNFILNSWKTYANYTDFEIKLYVSYVALDCNLSSVTYLARKANEKLDLSEALRLL